MGKINILDSYIFNRIAAGEVVERPKSIIKELVENSLDAGATSINIAIESGGIQSIRVTDNGCGMDRGDLDKAFLPHATSKILSVSDLDNIMTLGFRGEALSSIAAVSRVVLTSRMRGSEIANFLTMDNGVIVASGECGAPLGTSVAVEDLFASIPARKKFLGKPKAEEAEISNLVSRMILANHDVAIKYSADGKVVYQSGGRGLADAIVSVYGMEVMDNLSEINVKKAEFDDLKIYGFISRPGYSKYNRSYQTLIVNGRYVSDSDISFAVYSCFKDYLMTRQYPMYVLFVDLPADMVDVNIHPAKMQVRFAQPKRVLSVLQNVINETLYGLSTYAVPIKTADTQAAGANNENNIDKKNENFYKFTDKNDNFNDSFDNNGGINPASDLDINKKENGEKFEKVNMFSVTPLNNSYLNKPYGEAYDALQNLKEKPFGVAVSEFLTNRKSGMVSYKGEVFADDAGSDSLNATYIGSKIVDSFAESSIFGENFSETVLINKNSSKRIGKLFDTYILFQSGNNCYIIDQHAAHERLIYDKLCSDVQNKRVMIQNLLVPYAFSLSYDDGILIDDSLGEMEMLGVIVEKNAELEYVLTGVPFVSLRFDESQFVEILIESLKTKRLTAARFIREEIMQAACKAAVKGEDDLSENEIEALLLRMSETGTVLCPHGRPAVIKISRTEIEKWFKRKL